MTSDQIDRLMDQARSERSRYLLALCVWCIGFLMRRVAGTMGRLTRGAEPPRPTAPS